jgi:hypothetical protein
MSNFFFKLSAVSVLITLTACSSTPTHQAQPLKTIDIASTTLPNVAAEFTTTREGEAHPHEHDEHESPTEKVTWRFWRDSQQISIETPQLGMGELWQRDGQTMIHRKLYHDDQRAIEFQNDDLRILDSTPSWQKLALLIDPKLLEQLTASAIDQSDGYPVRDYAGTVAGTQWHIILRMDIGLPVLIERQQGNFSEHTELLQAYALINAPWQPTSTNGYDVIDYADLGDKESDPFVIKVQSQMGHDHHH